MTRTYQLKRRAERVAETRRRIVDATVALHTSVGPARTTISDIAELAGVQRHTVYAHFPDERELFHACSAHWRGLHPLPDSRSWERTADPARRLRAALQEVYAWYELVEDDLAIFSRDAGVHTMTAELVRQRELAVGSLRACSRTAGLDARQCRPRSGTRSTSRRGARWPGDRASRASRRWTQC